MTTAGAAERPRLCVRQWKRGSEPQTRGHIWWMCRSGQNTHQDSASYTTGGPSLCQSHKECGGVRGSQQPDKLQGERPSKTLG